MTATLVGVQWHLTVVLICVALMSNCVEHLLIGLGGPCVHHFGGNVYSDPWPVFKLDFIIIIIELNYFYAF